MLLGCLVTIAYQYVTWQYHSSGDVSTSLYWLKVQTSIVILSVPLMVVVFLQWTKQAYSFSWVAVLIGISLIFFTINLFSEFTVRYSGDIALRHYTMFSGEAATRLLGEKSLYMPVFFAYASILFVVLIVITSRLFKQNQFAKAAILIVTLLATIGASVEAVLMDAGMFDFVYLGGLPITILNFLACITVAISLELRTKSLGDEIEKREKLEAVFSRLAKGVSGENNDEFYINALSELQKLSQADVAYICLYEEGYLDKLIRTKVVLVDGILAKNFAYPAAITPIELLSVNDVVVIKSNAYIDFPSVPLFTKIKAQGVINSPMVNEHGDIEGSIVLVFKRVIENDEMFIKALNIFTSRIASEINRERLNTQLHQMAYYDYQTGLPNLSCLHDHIEKSEKHNTKNNTQSILFIFDLKGFTNVNRHYGFANAEKAIYELALRLRGYTDDEIITARVGGNKFAVLINNVQNASNGLIALHWEAIESLVRIPVPLDKRTLSLSCNGGAVVFPIQSETVLDPMRCAEMALAQSKQSLRNNLSLFNISILKETDRHIFVQKQLDYAIEHKTELFAVFQPKVDINGNLIGAEALARWANKELGNVSPDEFIKCAEKSGSIGLLGTYMISLVCEQISKWKKQAFTIPGRIAINVSPLQLADAKFVPEIVSLVKAFDVSPSQIEIELTESGLLTDIDESIDKLMQLKEAGFSIALDDFGTGYSSLSYLKDLPLDVLKVDRAFVNELEQKNTAELARSIIAIGHHMSMCVVAEGVEQKQQVETLHKMGCNIFQGYYFGRPMPAEEFKQWAENKKT